MMLQNTSISTAKKFLIIDLYSAANKGDAAILNGLLLSLRQQTSSGKFTIHTMFPDHLDKKCDCIVRHSLIPYTVDSISGIIRVLTVCITLIVVSILANFKINISFILPERYRLAFSDFLEADIIVGMGGGFYNDNYWRALPGRLFHLLMGKLLHKPVVISAHSFGPFKRKPFWLMARVVFNMIDAICVRDMASLLVLQALHIPSSKIHKVADSAWLVEAIPKDTARGLLQKQLGINLALRPVISVSARYWKYYSGINVEHGHENYIKSLANALDIIIEKYQATIVYLSTCTNWPDSNSDKQVGSAIRSRLSHPDKFYLASDDYTPEQLKAMYGLMDAHIGTRMHSVILALSAGTPCVGISYEPKLDSMMQEIGLQDYMIDIEEINVESIVAKVSNVLSNREKIVAVIKRELPRLQTMARQNAKIIAQAIH